MCRSGRIRNPRTWELMFVLPVGFALIRRLLREQFPLNPPLHCVNLAPGRLTSFLLEVSEACAAKNSADKRLVCLADSAPTLFTLLWTLFRPLCGSFCIMVRTLFIPLWGPFSHPYADLFYIARTDLKTFHHSPLPHCNLRPSSLSKPASRWVFFARRRRRVYHHIRRGSFLLGTCL